MQWAEVKKSVKNNEKHPLQPPSAFQATIYKVFSHGSPIPRELCSRSVPSFGPYVKKSAVW